MLYPVDCRWVEHIAEQVLQVQREISMRVWQEWEQKPLRTPIQMLVAVQVRPPIQLMLTFYLLYSLRIRRINA